MADQSTGFSFFRIFKLLLIIIFGPILGVLATNLLIDISHIIFAYPADPSSIRPVSYVALLLIYPLTIISIVPAVRFCRRRGISYWKFGARIGFLLGFFFSMGLLIFMPEATLLFSVLGVLCGIIIGLMTEIFERSSHDEKFQTEIAKKNED